MSNITFVREGNEVKIENGFDEFCNVKIRIHDHCGVMLDLEDFYGEFALEELELIVNKMKELNLENQTIR